MTASILGLSTFLHPATYILFAILAMTAPTIRSSWSLAHIGSAAALVLALLTSASQLRGAEGGDLLGALMITLISFLGWVIVSYSRNYLEGERCQGKYITMLLGALSAVSLIVLNDNLLVIGLGWTATSFCLHSLLTLYPERQGGLLAAHKKFIASRIADLCFLVALALIVQDVHSLSIRDIVSSVKTNASLSLNLHVATILIVAAIILRSAQIPVHGWLMQVMEAPTPVSALLHAGVINVGGFVLLRLSPLISQVATAQTILVVVGSFSVVVAGIVMMTRISIKVRLAWSTCAQQGFMLLECGLGLYSLAFLHILAHSCYKAYLFLGSGDTALEAGRRRFYASPSISYAHGKLRIGIALASVFLITAIFLLVSATLTLHLSPALYVIVGLAVAPFLWDPRLPLGFRVSRSVLIGTLYLVAHICTEPLFPIGVPSTFLTLWTITAFALLYGVQEWIVVRSNGVVSTVLYRWAYAGFYLDEWFTKLTFRVWPVHLPQGKGLKVQVHVKEAFVGEDVV